MSKKTQKPKPESDIDVYKSLAKRNDPEINKLIRFFKDLKTSYMVALNEISKLSSENTRLKIIVANTFFIEEKQKQQQKQPKEEKSIE